MIVFKRGIEVRTDCGGGNREGGVGEEVFGVAIPELDPPVGDREGGIDEFPNSVIYFRVGRLEAKAGSLARVGVVD